MKWYEILWQLPQWIAGRFYLYFQYRNVWNILKYNNTVFYVVEGQRGCVSFCKDYVFLSKQAQHSDYIIMHEYGHTIQSSYLGWLYLIVIGLPSLLWAFLHDHFLRKIHYYSFPTESWANRLGGN